MLVEGILTAFFLRKITIVTRFSILVTSFIADLGVGIYFCIQKNKL